MKIRIIGLLFFLLAIMIINSCENKPVLVPVTPADCDTVGITYNNRMVRIINNNCAYSPSCHAGGYHPDFTTYAGIKAYVDNGQVYDQLFVLKQMPLTPLPPLDPCSLAQFRAWIQAGAPE